MQILLLNIVYPCSMRVTGVNTSEMYSMRKKKAPARKKHMILDSLTAAD
jgi:hypothetical protein